MNRLLATVVLLACALPARAQFYTPETEYHDPVQRLYPVEAARVLAWVQNARGGKLTEVTYTVKSEPGKETVWLIEWKAAPGGTGRKVTVRYPEAALRDGAEWYRSVWKQISAAEMEGGAARPEIADAFWKGAGSAGISRMEGIASALQQVAAAPKPGAPEAAALAGTLAQTALPSFATGVTLDWSVLARSAAWLCVAEQQSNSLEPSLWAPVLRLASRGREAQAAWANSRPREEVAGLWHGWDVIIRQPPAGEGLPLMMQRANRLYVPAVFQAYGYIADDYYDLFAQLFRELFGPELRKRLYDYRLVPTYRANAVIAAGEFLAPDARHAWLEVLRKLPSAEGDAAGTRELASKAIDDQGSPAPLKAPSPELVQLLTDGLQKSAGPLIPVAVATARDLLGFGWEFTGLEYGTLFNHYSSFPSERAKADQIRRDWIDVIDGWSFFIREQKTPPLHPLADSGRCQFMTSSQLAESLSKSPPSDWPARPDAYLSRRWLLDLSRGLQYILEHDGTAPAADELIKRALREGDQLTLGGLLKPPIAARYDMELKWRYDSAIDALDLRANLMKAVPLSVSGPRKLLEERLVGSHDPLADARALEQLHWQTGVGFAPEVVFIQYVRANALSSARRFYDRWHGTMPDRYEFADKLGLANIALAVLENDAARVKEGVSHCGYTADRGPAITGALFAGQPDEVQKLVDGWLKGNPPARGVKPMTEFRDFMTMLPALQDPKHADHERALTAFPKAQFFLFPQWMLLTRARLSAEEGERFLSAGTAPQISWETPEFDIRPLALAYLKKDRDGFQDLYQRIHAVEPGPNALIEYRRHNHRLSGANGVLAASLRNRLLGIPVPDAEPDLRPSNGVALLPALRAILDEDRKSLPQK